MSVLPNGITRECNNHYVGSVYDLEILQCIQDWHKKLFRKKGDDILLTDVGLHNDAYPNRWALLADKDYHGALEFIGVILPLKKSSRGALSISNQALNRKLTSYCTIVENYFDGFRSLWNLFVVK